MARMVSPQGRGMAAGVSVVALVAVIVAFLVSMTVAYAFYISRAKVCWVVEKASVRLNERKVQVDVAYRIKQQAQGFLDGHLTGSDVLDFLRSQNLEKRDLPTDDLSFKRVLDALDVWIFRYQKISGQLKRELVNARNLAETSIEGKKVDQTAFAQLAVRKQRHLSKLDAFLVNEVKRKEQNVSRYNEEKSAFAMEHSNARDERDKLKSGLLHAIATQEERTKVVRRQLDFLRPGSALPRRVDGKVTASNWHTHKIVVDLGKHHGVFPGLILNVFLVNSEGRQEVKGRVQVMILRETSSTCNVMEESRRLPIVKGDFVHVPFIPIPAKKRFVIAGPFDPEAAYTKEQLIGLIKLNGGIIQEHVNLFTDCLIKGETKLVGGPDRGPEAAEEASEARTEIQMAKELSITMVDYLDFISHIRR